MRRVFTLLHSCRLEISSGNSMVWSGNPCVSVGHSPFKTTHLGLTVLVVDCVGDDWLGRLKPDLEARMARYEEGQIEFAILSLVKDPLSILVPSLAENIKSISALTLRLDQTEKTWRDFTVPHANEELDDLLTTTDIAYGLTQDHIDRAKVSEAVVSTMTGSNVHEIMGARQRLIASQVVLRREIREEMQSLMFDEERTNARSRDLGEKMQNFARKVKIREGG